MLDELLDLVDHNDQVVRQVLRSELYAKNLQHFRGVNAFLINSEYQLWIPRRAKDKQIFPLALDASMGGHVLAGESYEEAFARELIEELRIDATQVEHKFLGALNPMQHQTACFMKVYAIYSDQVPEYNQDDFVEYYWLTPAALLDRLKSGDYAKSDLSKIIKNLF